MKPVVALQSQHISYPEHSSIPGTALKNPAGYFGITEREYNDSIHHCNKRADQFHINFYFSYLTRVKRRNALSMSLFAWWKNLEQCILV